jgi:hypothetical protein
MTHPVPAAWTFACAHCGGAIRVGDAPTARCPFCQHVQTLPPAVVAGLERYQASAALLASRLAVEQREKSRWDTWYHPDGRARYGVGCSLAISAGMASVLALSTVAAASGILDEAHFSIVPFGVMGVFVLGMLAFWLLALRRPPPAPEAPPAVTARCPHCGGWLPFALGDLGRACPHCHGSVAVAVPVMAEALSAGALALRHAAMQRHRLERKATSHLRATSAGGIMPYVVVGSWLPMTGGIALVTAISSVTDPHSTPRAAVALTGLLALVNAGVLVLIHRWRAARRQRYRRMADIARADLAGAVITRVSDWVLWLNAFWAGPYAPQRLMVGACFHAVTGTLEGFPVAIGLDPVPIDSQHYEPHAEVLMAASLSEYPGHASVPADLQGRAQRYGFALYWNAGGFGANHLRPKELRRGDPDAIGQSLVAVAALLAEWAARCSAAPARALDEEFSAPAAQSRSASSET